MPTRTVPREAPTTSEVCPFLVPVVAGRLWLTPRSVYCRRRDGRLGLPERAAGDYVCATHAHLLCPGYLAGYAHQETARGSRDWPLLGDPPGARRG
jgi:hypothetical protein